MVGVGRVHSLVGDVVNGQWSVFCNFSGQWSVFISDDGWWSVSVDGQWLMIGGQ